MTDETPLTAKQIYDKINTGEGSPGLSEPQAAAREFRELLQDRVDEILALSREIGEGWQGPAGEAAAGAALPLAKAAEADAQNLAKAEESITQQMTDFGTVRSSVVPVSASKPEMSDVQMVNAILDGDTSGYDREVAAWRDASQQNVQAFGKYHQASTANGERLPKEYEPLTDPGQPIAMRGGEGPGPGDSDPRQSAEYPRGGTDSRPPAPRTTYPQGRDRKPDRRWGFLRRRFRRWLRQRLWRWLPPRRGAGEHGKRHSGIWPRQG